MNAPSEFVEGLVKSVDKEKLSNREKFLAATGIMACWTVLAITGHTPTECADYAETLTNAQFRRATVMVLSVLSKESLR